MVEDFLLGDNKLRIIFENGMHHVLESRLDYNIVFSGQLEMCLHYCKKREIAYMVSVVG